MAEPFFEATFTVAESLADDIGAHLLWESADGVRLIDKSCRVPVDLQDPDYAHWPQAPAGQARIVSTWVGEWQEDAIIAHIESACADFGVENAGPIQILRREDDDWAHSWKAFFKPLQLSPRIWVCPSWEVFETPENAQVLTLDPGMAFGTGHHATTSLCAEQLDADLAAMSPQTRAQCRLLDVGCGSGILAVAALRLGCGQAFGIDVDANAVQIAAENAQQNGVGERFQASDLELSDVKETYPVVVANILAPILEALAPALLARLERGGRLVMSGVLAEQAAELQSHFDAAAQEQNITLSWATPRHRAEWALLVADAG